MLECSNKLQQQYFEYEEIPILLVGESALELNQLKYGMCTYNVYTPYLNLHNLQVAGLLFEHYHFTDDYQLTEIQRNVFLPSAERAIVDSIAHLEYNLIEGAIIEAIQGYVELYGEGRDKLYEVCEHYNVDKDKVDYWFKEALG